MTILILTVGGSHQPLVTAIQSLSPDRVVFLCSEDAPTAKGSYVQVLGQGKVIKSHPGLEKPDLPNIVTLTRLGPDRLEVVRIRSFDSLEDCYLAASRVLQKLCRENLSDRVIADYTGGTKSMTAGLALAALDDERCEINLVAGTRTDLEKVRDRTQFARPVVVWDLRARRKLEEVKVPEAARASLERYRSDDGRLRVPLFAAWTLLRQLGDVPLGEWFASNASRIQNFLAVRNLSILAHGETPVDDGKYQSVGCEAIALCRDILKLIPRVDKKPHTLKQLPQRLHVLESGGDSIANAEGMRA